MGLQKFEAAESGNKFFFLFFFSVHRQHAMHMNIAQRAIIILNNQRRINSCYVWSHTFHSEFRHSHKTLGEDEKGKKKTCGHHYLFNCSEALFLLWIFHERWNEMMSYIGLRYGLSQLENLIYRLKFLFYRVWKLWNCEIVVFDVRKIHFKISHWICSEQCDSIKMM